MFIHPPPPHTISALSSFQSFPPYVRSFVPSTSNLQNSPQFYQIFFFVLNSISKCLELIIFLFVNIVRFLVSYYNYYT